MTAVTAPSTTMAALSTVTTTISAVTTAPPREPAQSPLMALADMALGDGPMTAQSQVVPPASEAASARSVELPGAALSAP